MSAPALARVVARRIEVEGFAIQLYAGGEGPPVLLLHGSGPGASSMGNWAGMLDRLAEAYSVTAMDLIGFGGSERKSEQPYFDVGRWLRQAHALLATIPGERVGIIGHSLSGALALKLAAVEPRVGAVIATGTMGAAMPVNAHLDRVWRCPRSRDDMAQAARVLVHNPARITDAYLDQRMATIGADGYADYFDAMFAGPFDRFIDEARLSDDELAAVRVPVMLVHGREDLPFPAETGALALLPKLRHADAMLLAGCGHSVAMERPEALFAAVDMMFGGWR